MSLLPSLPRSTPSTSSSPSTSSTPRAVSSPKDLETTLPAYSEEELRDHFRGRYPSDPVRFTDHPTVRVTSTDVGEKSSSLPSSNDFNDRMTSTFRSRSRSPAPSVIRDEGELRPQTSDESDHPLSHSWWGEEKHVVRPKKTEQTEALQSARKVSNNVIPVFSSRGRPHGYFASFRCR